LLTLVERKSRYTLACQLDSRHSAGVCKRPTSTALWS